MSNPSCPICPSATVHAVHEKLRSFALAERPSSPPGFLFAVALAELVLDAAELNDAIFAERLAAFHLAQRIQENTYQELWGTLALERSTPS